MTLSENANEELRQENEATENQPSLSTIPDTDPKREIDVNDAPQLPTDEVKSDEEPSSSDEDEEEAKRAAEKQKRLHVQKRVQAKIAHSERRKRNVKNQYKNREKRNLRNETRESLDCHI